MIVGALLVGLGQAIAERVIDAAVNRGWHGSVDAASGAVGVGVVLFVVGLVRLLIPRR